MSSGEESAIIALIAFIVASGGTKLVLSWYAEIRKYGDLRQHMVALFMFMWNIDGYIRMKTEPAPVYGDIIDFRLQVQRPIVFGLICNSQARF
jgi:hypothetical protein